MILKKSIMPPFLALSKEFKNQIAAKGGYHANSKTGSGKNISDCPGKTPPLPQAGGSQAGTPASMSVMAIYRQLGLRREEM